METETPLKTAKLILGKVFIVAGILPATFLFVMCIVVFFLILIDFDFTMGKTIFLISCVFGMIGYIGLILVMMDSTIKKWKIITCLALGIISLFVHIYLGGNSTWQWFVTMDEPAEWFLMVWPAIVALVSIVMLIFDLIKERKIKIAPMEL